MTEIVEIATACKQSGNVFFKSKQYAQAIVKYDEGLTKLEDLDAETASKSTNLMVALRNNRCMCNYMLKSFEEAVKDAQIVLTMSPKNPKAHMRLILSCYSLERYGDVLKFYGRMKVMCGEGSLRAVQESYQKSLPLFLKSEKIDIGKAKLIEGNNTYVMWSEDECVIIDAPLGIDAVLKKLIPGKKKAHLILTHGHLDHIFDTQYLKKHENMELYAHEKDQSFMNLGEESTIEEINSIMPLCSGMDVKSFLKAPQVQKMVSAQFHISFKNIVPDHKLKGEEVLKFFKNEFRIIHTPGHSEGCICIYNEKHRLLFTGDTLFAGSVGRTDFRGGSASTLKNSIQKKLYSLPENTRVLPGHPANAVVSTIGREKKTNVAVKMM